MQCRACLAEIPGTSRFCPTCGAAVASSDAPTASTAATPDPGLSGKATSPARPSPPARPSRPPSTDSIDQARFIPGTMLAGRYRIVALIGRGGMGEVYRAEDLKLGQPVALKFLPEDFANHPDRLARFHQEVHVARQVSHPNVCRVYDIGEADGQHFLSMEYVDGEDLASLVRRIGRLPAAKATELARQICAGLAAAHDKGVLHRDLKPANVLIDGRGRARLADFGLAGLVEERRPDGKKADGGVIMGTPAYMAPEQFAGQGTSTRSDVYALGLVLYELFTGKPALTTSKVDGFGSMSDRSAPTSLTTHVSDIDPLVERVILRCLEKDPARRPASAIAVAAALPGGDPLAAALAAGETPSPEMVAAAGEVGTLSPARGLAYLALILLGVAAIAWSSSRQTLIGQMTIEKGSEVLTEQARTIVRSLGYTDTPADEEYGYVRDDDYLRYLEEHDPSPARWRVLKTSPPSALMFWYRQSPRHLTPIAFGLGTSTVTLADPPETVSGMVSIQLDPAGRLTRLSVVPPQVEEAAGVNGAGRATPNGLSQPDWGALFAHAGLPIDRFVSTPPQWLPPSYADARAAWAGTYPDRPDLNIRVEAAAVAGKPIYFDIVAPWTRPQRVEVSRAPTLAARITGTVPLPVAVLVIAGAAVVARRNLRLGRGDRRGALRVTVVMGGLSLAYGLLTIHSPSDLFQAAPPATLVLAVLGAPVFHEAAGIALAIWVIYIALEPHVRRLWPETLIGWSRLLDGRFRDPLVGRDILVGTLGGVVVTIIIVFALLVPTWLGLPAYAISPRPSLLAILYGGRATLAALVGAVEFSVGAALQFVLMLFLCTAVFRSRQVGIVAATALAVAVAPSFARGNPVVDLPASVLWAAVVVFVTVRFGLLPLLAMAITSATIGGIPISFASRVPYAAWSFLLVGTILALAAYGFHTALAGRPIFGGGFLKDEPSQS